MDRRSIWMTGKLSFVLLVLYCVTDEDHICKSCFHLLMQSVHKKLGRDEGPLQSAVTSQPQLELSPRVVGHCQICILCRRSILRKRSDIVLRNNPTEIQQQIFNIISQSTSREITTMDKVCHPCWLKTRKTAICMQPISKDKDQLVQADQDYANNESIQSIEHQLLEFDEPERTIQPEDAQISKERKLSRSSSSRMKWIPASPPATSAQIDSNTNTITLSLYRRAPNTSSHCVFSKCPRRDLHRVSDMLRITIASNQKYYLPPDVRICSHHLTSNEWDTLFDSDNSLQTFTVKHVEHMFSFIKSNVNVEIDFNNVLSMDEHLFQYWLGMTKENFNILLSNVPRIHEIHRGVFGLVALLIKDRNGESDERIAGLMKVPRSTLERLMGNVRKIFSKDLVPR